VAIIKKKIKEKVRPVVRIFSKTNYDNFKERLSTTDWTCIYKETDLNNAYDKFHSVVTTAFNESLPSKKLSKQEPQLMLTNPRDAFILGMVSY